MASLRHPTSPWDARTTRLLRALAHELTAKEIAIELGLTRCQVISKCQREGIKLPGTWKARAHKEAPAQRPVLGGMPVEVGAVGTCMYLLAEGRYCGEPVAVPRSSWCEEHRKLVLR